MSTLLQLGIDLRWKLWKVVSITPSRYLSAPGLSWGAMLSIKKVDLDLVSDHYMHLVFEKGMRVGASHISKRYSKANSKYLKSYHTKQASKHII